MTTTNPMQKIRNKLYHAHRSLDGCDGDAIRIATALHDIMAIDAMLGDIIDAIIDNVVLSVGSDAGVRVVQCSECGIHIDKPLCDVCAREHVLSELTDGMYDGNDPNAFRDPTIHASELAIMSDDNPDVLQRIWDNDPNGKLCPSCGTVGDPTCWDGTGICGEHNATCYFCDNPVTQTMDCDDGKTHGVCDGCADAWTVTE